ncbi:unnamed protein product [Rangifer tarandus platyrhynchus]|uniref:Uncharacterized protein n=2 Tax=Rangifer tarandus platyrhynchus TaxID=3082113 RepID=A0ABN8ZMZ1_RANTA|nr:unnamed protein product [Rangifer tarandus platyrhynchus]
MVGVMETSFLRIYGSMLCLLGLLLSVSLTLQQATVDPHLHQRLPDTQRPFGCLSCGVTAPLSWVLVGTRFCLCPPRVSLSPVLWKFCNRILLTFKVRFPGDSQSLLLDSQRGKSVASPRIFATVLEFLWCNCSPVCISPTWQVSGGANGDLLQAGPEPPTPPAGLPPPWPRSGPLLTRASSGDARALTGRPGSVSCGVTAPFAGSWCMQSFVCAIQAPLVGLG